MPRPERSLDPATGPVQRFAHELRELRQNIGNPGYRVMAREAGFSVTTLSDAAGGRQFPGLAVTLAYVRVCGGDEDWWRGRWQQVARELAEQRGDTGASEGAPYAGLAPFGVEDSDRFFGRKAVVDGLLARVAKDRSLAVVGASGVGKSSILRAGVVAAARKAGTRVVVMVPGTRPAEAIEEVPESSGLLVVDQFEELFTLCDDAGQRDRFVSRLLSLCEDEAGTRVMIGMRADFFAQCARYGQLVAVLSERTVLVGPMSDGELSEAIVEPARLVGLTVEQALVVRVLSDARGQPGALPLVSHALLETWRQRRSSTLTLKGYEAAGGIHGAITRTAEAVYTDLTPQQRTTMRQLCIRLTAVGEGTEDTRRRVQRTALDLPDVRTVIERLVAARLVVASDDSVELAHEALIQAWPRMQEWLSEDRDGLRTHSQLTQAATGWEALGHDTDALYRGARLDTTRDWVTRVGADVLTGNERRFLSASVEAETRRMRRHRILTTSLVVLLVLAVASTVVAGWQWNNAVHQRQEALSRQLATEALSVAGKDVARAMQLSLNAVASAPTMEARSALFHVAGRRTYSGRLPHGGMVKDLAFSPAGSVVAAAGQDGVVTIWDKARRAKQMILTGHDSAVRAVAFSPDGRWLVSGALNGSIVVWDHPIGKRRLRLSGHRGLVNSVAVSLDGTLIASLGADNGVKLWRSTDGVLVGELPGSGGKEAQVVFGPNNLLVAAGRDGTAVVWDVRSGRRIQELPTGRSPLYAAAFSPDGHRVAVAGGDNGQIDVFDLHTGARQAVLRGWGIVVSCLAFAPDGTLVAGDYDGRVTRWNLARQDVIDQLEGPTGGLYGVAVSPDGETIAAASRDRSVYLWDRATMPMANHTGEIHDVDTAPDGHSVLSADLDGVVTVWNLTTHTPRAVFRSDQGVTDAKFSPDGEQVAIALRDGTIHLWHHDDDKITTTLEGHTDGVNTMAFTADGSRLMTGSTDRTARVWNLVSRRSTQIARHPTQIMSIDLTPDEHTVVAASQDGTVTLFDLTHNTQTGKLKEAGGIATADLDPRGEVLALGRQDGRTALWRIADRTRTGLLAEHVGPVTAISYSSDGKLLATGGSDGTLRLHHTADQTLWAAWPTSAGIIGDLTFNHDSTHLYTGTLDRTVTPWTIDTPSATHHICHNLARDFNQSNNTCPQQ